MPLIATRPARIPTIDRPKTETINSSGDWNFSTKGRATRMKNGQKRRPDQPPEQSEEAKAADNARAAWPFFAIGKPSKHRRLGGR